MFRQGTLFVIGAGASCEVGLPTGDGLRTHIISALKPNNENIRKEFANPQVNDAVVEATRNSDQIVWHSGRREYKEMAARVCEALPLAQSIDNYLDAYRGNKVIETLGKVGIAQSVLEAESKSALVQKYDIRGFAAGWSKNLLESWYVPFIRLLQSERSLDEVERLFQNVTFIIFNYDRCFEAFLVNAITSYYQIGVEQAKQIISGAGMIHPYGKVGNLPWQGGTSVPLGGSGSSYNLLRIAREIKTFTESVDSGLAADIRGTVAGAETIVFLGFGFLEQNMRLLTPEGGGRARRVFATTSGISASDVEIVEQRISTMLGKRAYNGTLHEHQQPNAYKLFIERGYCSDLMKNHWLRLTQA